MTPSEKLTQANHDYHEAVDEIFAGEEVLVGVKAELGSVCDSIFQMMTTANELVEEYYVEEDD